MILPTTCLHDLILRLLYQLLKYPPKTSQLPTHNITQPRSTSLPRTDSAVPRIVETPPTAEEVSEPQMNKQSFQYPERTSSQSAQSSQKQPISQPNPQVSPQPNPEPPANRVNVPSPSPLPVTPSRADAPIPTPSVDDKKSDKKGKKEGRKKVQGPGKPVGLVQGSDEKDKKDKKKDDKNRSKLSSEKMHDNARLDVLQSTMETTTRGRESFLDGNRKAGEHKKEKDGIFSSLFGGGKKKADRDPGVKKGSSLRTISPEPPHRVLKPDIDYNWTRFSIMEERATIGWPY
ncbi:hypothetical protein DID88_008027 [Monilinia fructigena]|uniref:Uncharacterized protein n=1 Tax=Monilinia fructigena TaxID=38457 RepID=A0A395J446_9HELO|nr:hypothetical protein DID88_008027 [Monilinia fructigena]